MSQGTLNIAVVGHTNVGKTSLMRTLTRNTDFGEVAASPGTTRHVEAAELAVGSATIVFFDTPGLEDAPGVLAHLKAQVDGGQDWLEAIAALSSQEAANGAYSQEGKALRQVVGSDLLLYVIDVRDSVRAKHRDELEILMRCGRPIMAVLNFVSQSRAGEDSWRSTLARTNIHAVAPFDTFIYSEAGEIALYEKARTLLDRHADLINQRLTDIQAARASQMRAATMTIAEFAVQLGALEETVDRDAEALRDEKVATLKAKARKADDMCKDRVLKIFGFDADLHTFDDLDFEAGLWEADPFDPETLASFGLNTTAAAATGAAVGLGIDFLVGGLTLGAAAITGAVVGTGLDAFRRYGRDIRDRLAGRALLKINPETLAMLLARQAALVSALSARGHGAQDAVHPVSVKTFAQPLLEPARNALKGQSGDVFLAETSATIVGTILAQNAA